MTRTKATEPASLVDATLLKTTARGGSRGQARRGRKVTVTLERVRAEQPEGGD